MVNGNLKNYEVAKPSIFSYHYVQWSGVAAVRSHAVQAVSVSTICEFSQ